MATPKELLDELLMDRKTPEDLLGKSISSKRIQGDHGEIPRRAPGP